MSKKIVYVGLERCDFIYHLITILSLKGSVLAVDNSRRQDLYECESQDSNKAIVEWRNITFASNIDMKQSNTNDYDYVVIYAGLSVEDEDFSDAFTLLMPDYSDLTLRVMDTLPKTIKNPVIILRDNCTKKVNEKGIAVRLETSTKNIAGHINLTIQDMAAYVALTHNRHQNIKGLSDTMVNALTYTTSKIFETDEKHAEKLVAQAKKIK